MFTMKFNGKDVNFNSHYFFKNQVTIRAQIQETQRRVEEERHEQEEARQRYEELEVILHTLKFAAWCL